MGVGVYMHAYVCAYDRVHYNWQALSRLNVCVYFNESCRCKGQPSF